MPGKYLVVTNSADNTPRTWLDLDGELPIMPQVAPTALSATATLTIAQLLTLLIVVSGTSAKTLTLPTGTLTDAGIINGGLAVDRAFDWTFVNIGTSSGAITLAAGTGHTIVGATVTAIGTSATYRTRKTAANTFITYRV